MYKNQKHFSSTRKTSSASTPKTYSKITIGKSTEYFSFFNKVITPTTEKRTTSHQLTFVNVSFFDSFSRGREISKPSLPAFSSDFTFYLLFQRFFFYNSSQQHHYSNQTHEVGQVNHTGEGKRKEMEGKSSSLRKEHRECRKMMYMYTKYI